MSRLWVFWSKYGLDMLILIAAAESAVGTAFRQDPEHPTGVWLWLEVAAVAALVLALLLRRRLPFAAPAAVWVLSATLSFLDGELIVAQPGLVAAGLEPPCCWAICATSSRPALAWLSC